MDWSKVRFKEHKRYQQSLAYPYPNRSADPYHEVARNFFFQEWI